ncbi:DNA-binding protein [Streptomyces sp. NPDC002917]|uniref:DNA-binding protein n=1 Tax=Streptomyces sp. NPDC002917 TaxID=3364671 RepID=UPI00368656E5
MGVPPRTLLKVLVTQRRMRYAEFERIFTDTAQRIIGRGAANPTVGESQFRRWTSGRLKGLPNPDTCRVLEEIFGVPAAQLFAAPAASVKPRETVFNLKCEIDMTARKAQEDAGATATSISDTTIEQLRDDLADLARTYSARPAYEVWSQGRRIRGEVEAHRERTQIPAQQQELLILAGQAASLLASSAFDLGDLSGAKRLARSAGLYGESARFNPLRAYAEGSLAYIAYFAGAPSRAATLAGRALLYPGIGDVAARRLRAIEARAHGHRGDVEAARTSIILSTEEGQGTHDDLHDGISGEFGFTNERLSMSNSSTALLTGDSKQAAATAQRALALILQKPAADRSSPVLGGASADLAMARLMSGDVDGAADSLTTLWAIPPDERVLGLLARACRIQRYLSEPRFRGSVLLPDLCDRIETYTRMSVPFQLGSLPARAQLDQ